MITNYLSKYRNSLLWALVILILCLSPSSGYPKVSIPHLDKVAHFCLYGVFAALLISESNPLRTRGSVTKQAKLIGFIVATAFGGVIELLQGTSAINRGCSIFDFFSNAAGAVTAVLTYRFFNKLLRGLI